MTINKATDRGDSYGPEPVRMFYRLVLRTVLPHNPTGASSNKKKGVTLSVQEWAAKYCEALNLQLEALLESQEFQIAFDEKTGVDPGEKQQLTYLIPFLVSRVHEFKADDIVIPKPGFVGFRIKDRAFSSVQKALAQKIRDALRTKVAIHELVFNMATSRSFIFEVYYEGSFRVRREFSGDDIEAEGSVRDALESFFDEMSSAIEPFELTRTPSRYQRSRNNEYLFGVSYAPHMAFSEKEVHGEGCYAIRGDASTDEVNEYGLISGMSARTKSRHSWSRSSRKICHHIPI